ncbi:MAG TPA: hypothetical protein VF857_03215 [Spirochaetota bacterium]
MRKIFPLVLFFAVCGAVLANEATPAPVKPELSLGTWQYGVYLGKNRVGIAYVTLAFEGGLYVSKLEMTLRMGDPIVTTKEVTKETITFNPVSFSSSNVVVLKDNVSRDLVTAEFVKNVVKLKHGKEEKTVSLNGDFVVSGNALTSALIRNKFAKGFEAKSMVYDPTIDEDTTVPVSEKVIGKETVDLPSGKMELIHTVQAIGPVRSINNWVDQQGTSYKTSIEMLNSTIDLYLEQKSGDKK